MFYDKVNLFYDKERALAGIFICKKKEGKQLSMLFKLN